MNFKRYLQNELSHKEFSELHKTVGLSPKKTTMILDRPSQMEVGVLRKIAKMVSRNPVDLIMEYDCGKNTITLNQAEELGVEYAGSFS